MSEVRRRLPLAAAVFAAVALVVYSLRSVFLPVVAAALLAYLLDPLIDRLERLRVPRSASIATLLLIVGAGGATVLVWVVPALAQELDRVARALPEHAIRLLDASGPFLERHFRIQLPGSAREAMTLLVDRIAGVTSLHSLDDVAGLVGSVFAGTAAAVTRILQLLLLPVLAFYFLRDYDRMLQSARDLLPFSQRDRALRLGREFDRILGGYVRGQLTVCACLAVLYATGLWLAGIEGGVPVGLLAGALFLLPYLGSVLGLVTALSLALVQYGADRHLLYVLATFGVAQGIESWFLTPRIVGERLGLHPVAVILALFAGGELLGFFGVLIALPLAALGKVALTSALSELGREAR